MDFIERVRSWFNDVKAAPTERKIVDMLAGGGVSDDKFPARVTGQSFIAGSTYFGVRLSGMHLVDGRRFLTQRLPLVVCLADFQVAGERRSIPFAIGPDFVRKKLQAAGIKENLGQSAWVELSDLTVVRPTPVNNSNLYLCTGLFSVPGDDLVKLFLNMVGTIGTALADPTIAPALRVADTVYDSIGTLLGFNQVEQLVTAAVGNALTAAGSGYLLMANVSPQAFDVRSARVIGGRLHWPTDRNGGQAVIEFDHTLLALERYETVTEEGSGLADALFGLAWLDVRKATGPHGFNEALEKLTRTIIASNDLTEGDRVRLITAYGRAATEVGGHWGTTNSAIRDGRKPETFQKRLEASAMRLRRADSKTRIAGLVEATADQVKAPFDLRNPQETDPDQATREDDNRAILRLAKAIVIDNTISIAETRLAAMAVARALVPEN